MFDAIFFGTLLGSFCGLLSATALIAYIAERQMKKLDKENEELFEKTLKPLLELEMVYAEQR